MGQENCRILSLKVRCADKRRVPRLQEGVTGGLTEPAELHRWTSQTALYYVQPEAPSPRPGWYPLDQLCLVHAVEPQREIRGGSLVPC